YCSLTLRYLHSFPTRRSSDLPAPPKKHNQHVSKAIKHALFLLIFLVFARSWYQGTIGNFYAFYAIDTYGISISRAQIFIFTFLRSEEHTSELQSRFDLVCRLL